VTIFLPYYVAALALLYFELRGVRPNVPAAIRLPAWACLGGLVASYAAQLQLIWCASIEGATYESWRLHVPIGVAMHDVRNGSVVAGALLALALFQSFALFALYRSPTARWAVVAAVVAMALLSVAAPAFISPDPYAYVGDALLGRGAYAPPAGSFAGEFASINRFFPAPMLPSPYGPLWEAVSRVSTEPFATLLGKLIALRVLGLLSYVALLGALRAFGLPRSLLAIAAVNPGVFLQYVAGAHNDLLGIAIVVAAGAFARRSPFVASGLLVVAGLIKLPFVLLGLPVLAAVRQPRLRYACAALTVAAAIGISFWGASASYLNGLTVHVPAPGPVYVLNLIVSLLAIAAIAVALVGGPRLRAAIWLIPMASSYIASWYLIYALPYALARRRMLAYLLIAFPFASMLVDAKFMQWWTYAIVLPVVIVVSVFPSRTARRTA
jgi:hypothetical protein